MRKYRGMHDVICKGQQEVKFEVNDQVLYIIHQHPKVNQGRAVRQVLPESLRGQVMNLAHDSLLGGHLGVRKTTDRILGNFYQEFLLARNSSRHK